MKSGSPYVVGPQVHVNSLPTYSTFPNPFFVIQLKFQNKKAIKIQYLNHTLKS
jgi:hypothetical protein